MWSAGGILAAVAIGLAMAAGPSRGDEASSVVDRPSAGRGEPLHAADRAPLRPSVLIKLPVGAVRPRGWLRRQLELQAEGFHGHLTEISTFLRKEDNSWLSAEGQGRFGWEEVPYWLKGFGDCAYLLGDEQRIAEARVWIEAAIASQREDGFFGPRGNGAKATVSSTEGKYDLWPNMVMLNALQSHHEFTGDPRVLELMTRYFRWELGLAEEEFLPPYWQQQRAADNLASVHWLYNRTGEPWLLDLAAKIHRRAADWTGGIASWHNVNAAQAFGGPATFWRQTGEPRLLEAAYRNYDTIRQTYGQVPGALWGGDENSRPGYADPRQAIETCGIVEFMLSCERLTTITGDPLWADRCEDAAFNMLPAALTADMKALRYLTAPNQAVSDRSSHAPGIQNGGPMFRMDPHDHRCCQHNFGHGWPYLAEHLWMATGDRGLALVFPLASSVKALVGEGAGREVEWTVATRYPFRSRVELTLQASAPVRFPLVLRIPGWAEGARVSINGKELDLATRPLSYARIDRTWSDGDTVGFELPMEVRMRTWEKNHGSVSVDRGPLTYSLAIGERLERSGGTDAWPAYEIFPTTPWNYALWLSEGGPAEGIRVEERPWPSSDEPWTPESTPVVLEAQGRRVPEWVLDRFGLVAPLRDSPVRTDQPTERIRLIPMGAARLRVSAFPVAGQGPDAHVWEAPPTPLPYAASASHCFENDTVAALGDRVEPASSSDQSLPRFTWWPHQGGTEWVSYDLGEPRRISSVAIYWFDDTTAGGGCALPESWRLLVDDGEGWKPVAGASSTRPVGDRPERLEFPAVEARSVRLEVKLRPGRSAGILEWGLE